MKKIIASLRNTSLKVQVVLSVASFLFYGFASSVLETSYTASKFPVPYFVGQTSFDAVKIKAWYQYMVDAGTFEVYFKTQLIDFLFILSVVLGGFFIWTLIANLHQPNSFFRKYGYVLAFSLPLAGLFDVFENLVSFVMIANPKNFNNSIVYIYSSFASIKFGFWMIALVGLLLSVVVLLISKVLLIFKRPVVVG